MCSATPSLDLLPQPPVALSFPPPRTSSVLCGCRLQEGTASREHHATYGVYIYRDSFQQMCLSKGVPFSNSHQVSHELVVTLLPFNPHPMSPRPHLTHPSPQFLHLTAQAPDPTHYTLPPTPGSGPAGPASLTRQQRVWCVHRRWNH